MNAYPKSDKAIAEFWGVKIRTLYRWKGSGAPITNHKEMLAWLATRKNLPRVVLARIKLSGDKNVSSPASGGVSGAAAALKRLEGSELHAFDRLQAALARGNALEIREAREGWLRIGDALRKYDLLVEQNRRDAGELVPICELEKFLGRFMRSLETASTLYAEEFTNAVVGKPEPEIYEMVRNLFTESLIGAALSYMKGGLLDPDPRLVAHAEKCIEKQFGWRFRSQEAA
jgi:hypothetical protein